MSHREFFLLAADGEATLIGTLAYPQRGIFATRDIGDDFYMDYALWCPACGRAWLKSRGHRSDCNLPWPQSSYGWGIQARYCADHFLEWEIDRGPPRHGHAYSTSAGPAPGTVLWNSRYSGHIGHGLWSIMLANLTAELRRRELDAWVRADLAINPNKHLILE